MEGARPARSGGRPPRALREGGRLGKPSTHGDKKRAALMASPICSTLHLHCTQLTASLRFGEQRHRLSRRGEGCRGCGLHGMRATGDIAIEARRYRDRGEMAFEDARSGRWRCGRCRRYPSVQFAVLI